MGGFLLDNTSLTEPIGRHNRIIDMFGFGVAKAASNGPNYTYPP